MTVSVGHHNLFSPESLFKGTVSDSSRKELCLGFFRLTLSYILPSQFEFSSLLVMDDVNIAGQTKLTATYI